MHKRQVYMKLIMSVRYREATEIIVVVLDDGTEGEYTQK